MIITAFLLSLPLIQVRADPVAPAARELVVAVLGALPLEIDLLEQQLTDKQERAVQKIRFVSGRLLGKKVVVGHSGIGKVNAAATAILMIEHFHPSAIIFTGTAGGIHPELNPGDIVIGGKTCQHDLGELTTNGFRHMQMTDHIRKQPHPPYFQADANLLKLAQRVAAELELQPVGSGDKARAPRIITGVIATGDVFVASSVRRAELRKQHQADATEMEGAAVAQVCWQQDVPCLVIRCLSDTADDKAQADFETFAKAAAANSAQMVKGIVGRLEGKVP
jgi:adenosylhomocysteine nucleosidase